MSAEEAGLAAPVRADPVGHQDAAGLVPGDPLHALRAEGGRDLQDVVCGEFRSRANAFLHPPGVCRVNGWVCAGRRIRTIRL